MEPMDKSDNRRSHCGEEKRVTDHNGIAISGVRLRKETAIQIFVLKAEIRLQRNKKSNNVALISVKKAEVMKPQCFCKLLVAMSCIYEKNAAGRQHFTLKIKFM